MCASTVHVCSQNWCFANPNPFESRTGKQTLKQFCKTKLEPDPQLDPDPYLDPDPQ